jgi:osmotically-inducible protein OsmY
MKALRRIWAPAVAAAFAVTSAACSGACQNTADGLKKDAEKNAEKARDAAEEAARKATEAGAAAATQVANQVAAKVADQAKEAGKAVGETMAAASNTFDVKASLLADSTIDASNVNVDTDGKAKTVTLKGSVPTAEQKAAAAQLAASVATGYKVVNQLVVARE